ncbi:MAG: putative NBD/HSP70 family sugar kinase [Gammaproteobacteria bacterium]|jgi:predicted NBD/HSP70 family sugar kinase
MTPQSKNRMELGEQNRRLVLAEILYHRLIARAQIAANVQLTAASVSRITKDLIAIGLVEEGEPFVENNRAGRKFVGLRIKPDSCFVTAISINAFRQDIVVADLANNVIASKKLTFDRLSNAEQVLDRCAQSLNKLVTKVGIDRSRLVGCGIAITGSTDPDQLVLRTAPALNWGPTQVADIVRKHIDCPIYLDNIANAKNITAHCFGPTGQINNVLLFNVSLAIGCSLMINGHIYRGADFQGGIIESMMIPDFKLGKLVPIDQIAGGHSVLNPNSNDPQGKQLDQVISAAARGDKMAQSALESAGSALAIAVHNTHSLLHPQAVIVSGPLLESDYYQRSFTQSLKSLMGEAAVDAHILISPMSSLQAAQSLVIYQSIMQTDFTQLAAFQSLAS